MVVPVESPTATDRVATHRKHRRTAMLKLVLKLLQAIAIPFCIRVGEFPRWFDLWLVFLTAFLAVTAVREYREQTAGDEKR